MIKDLYAISPMFLLCFVARKGERPPHFWMGQFLKSRYQSKTRFLKSAKWPLSPGSSVDILLRKLVFRGDTGTFERPCESPKGPLKCRHLSYGFLCFSCKIRMFWKMCPASMGIWWFLDRSTEVIYGIYEAHKTAKSKLSEAVSARGFPKATAFWMTGVVFTKENVD